MQVPTDTMKTNRIIEKIRGIADRNPLLKHIGTLFSGMAMAQAIQLVLTVFIARLFLADVRGLFAIYGSVVALSVSIAAFRYDIAIVLPRSNHIARLLHKLSTRAIVFTASITSIVCLVLTSLFNDLYHSAVLTHWLWVSGLSVFLLAQVANTQYLLTREERFGDIAKNRVIEATGTAGMQLLLGIVWGPHLSSLILGTLIGQLITFLSLEWRVRDLRVPIERPQQSMKAVAYRYRKMPLLNGPNTLVDAIRNNGINMLIAAHAVAALGQFNLAWTALQVPVGLISGSVSQVFLKKLAATKRGEMTALLRFVLVRAALVALVPFVLLYLLAPWLFTLIFGGQWAESADFARALVPWLFMMVLTSPISHIFVVTETQQRMLIFAIIYCIVPLTWLALSPYDLRTTVVVLGLLMALMLGVMLVMSFSVAKRFDRQAPECLENEAKAK